MRKLEKMNGFEQVPEMNGFDQMPENVEENKGAVSASLETSETTLMTAFGEVKQKDPVEEVDTTFPSKEEAESVQKVQDVSHDIPAEQTTLHSHVEQREGTDEPESVNEGVASIAFPSAEDEDDFSKEVEYQKAERVAEHTSATEQPESAEEPETVTPEREVGQGLEREPEREVETFAEGFLQNFSSMRGEQGVPASTKIFDVCSNLFNSVRENKLFKTFVQRGRLIRTDSFYFYAYQNQLMVYQYFGADMNVRVPAYVGNLPVTILSEGFLNGNGGVMSDYRLRGMKSAFSFESLSGIDTSFNQSFKTLLDGVQSVRLSNTLKVMIGKPFWGCAHLTELVLPESLSSCTPDFYDGSAISRLVFNGGVPENFNAYKFSGDVLVRR